MSMRRLKEYQTVDEYKSHQIAKTSNPKVRKYFSKRYDGRLKLFTLRLSWLRDMNFIKPGWKGLSLGSRLGEEVDAMQIIGLDAIGVDLVPHPPQVLEGDFMDLKFEDESFDVIYTNSLDHALSVKDMMLEAYRVLKHKGFLVLDIFPGENNSSGYEVWELDVTAMINMMTKEFMMELIYVNSKLPRLYRFKHHKETQAIFRKGTK